MRTPVGFLAKTFLGVLLSEQYTPEDSVDFAALELGEGPQSKDIRSFSSSTDALVKQVTFGLRNSSIRL